MLGAGATVASGTGAIIGSSFWGYASILFDFLVVFILPLAFAVRELVLLRRHDSDAAKRNSG